MKAVRILTLLFAIVVVLSGCGDRKAKPQWEGTAIPFKYASLLHVEENDGCRLVTIDNPWRLDGPPLHRYLLVPYAATVSQPIPEGVTIVRTPLRRSVVFTSVHCALIGQLQANAQVAGVADLKYIKVPFVQEGVKKGDMADCGDGMNPVVEKIIDAEADAILLSPFENAGGYGRMEDINIPIIECAEYMEQTPLARAEWVRFYGMLYGQEARADSLFSLVETNYRALQQLAAQTTDKPSVIVDKMAGPVWYVPGGRSTIGQMLGDANADYPWADDTHSGSLQLPFEAVLERGGQCQKWLLRYDSEQQFTLDRIHSENNGYRMMRPVKEGEVYGCNVSTSMFYEETPFRPDLLLQDFIHILHPDIPNLPPLRYYHKLEREQ